MEMWVVLYIIPAWLYGIIFVILSLYVYGIWPYWTTAISLPGPTPKSFVGNVLDKNKLGSTPTDLKHGKIYGRVFLTWMGRVPYINVTDPDMIKQILVKDFPNFTNRFVPFAMSRTQRLMVLFSEDDHWKFVRTIVTPSFSSGKMRGMVSLIQNCVDDLLHNLEQKCKSRTSFDLQPVFGAFTLDVIGAVGFGIDTAVQKNPNDKFLEMARRQFEIRFKQASAIMLSLLFPFLIPVLEKLKWTFDDEVSVQYFQEVLSKTIKERRLNGSSRKDVLQLLLDNNISDLQEVKSDDDVDLEMLQMDNHNFSRNQKLTDEEVMSQTILFLLAGYETTSSLLSYLGYNLALNQECQDRLIDEIDDVLNGDPPTYNNVMSLPYLEMCMSESQRLHSIFPELNRRSKHGMVIKGHYIPPNTGIRFPVSALHHDPEFWPDPDKFDPERFSPEAKAARNSYVYLPFGGGPRNCVGMRLALMEAKMAIVAILQKFRFVRSSETEVPLTLKYDHFIHPLNGIWLKVEPRE